VATEDFDVVVVGSRVAGAPTAMLLARAGLGVVLVDRARFPSDAVSSHQLQVPGAAALARWGLLGDVVGAQPGAAVRELALTVRGTTVTGRLPVVDGVGVLVSPRRRRLDHLLRQAAAGAGVALADRFDVEGVEVAGGRVVGVRGRDANRRPRVLRARLVVGADGKESRIARAVHAPVTRSREPATFSTFSYWAGGMPGPARLFHLPGRAVAVFPTDGDQTVVFTSAPRSSLAAARVDPADFVRRTLASSAPLRRAVQGLERVERVRLVPDVPNRVRVSHGPGWALVGDAGFCMDPVSAQGMTNAFLGAELLADAVVGARDAGLPLDARLPRYQQARDRLLGPRFDFAMDLARLRPTPRAEALIRLLGRDPRNVDGLLAVFSGVVDHRRFFGPGNLLRMLGPLGLARVAVADRLAPSPGYLTDR
jgi:2-polyprenyl-6-methoxyphenol hydroxylase-like FAD-dependent oxidoreductase